MTKYDNCKKDLIHKIITEFNLGKLKSSSGHKVKSKKQAIAIGLTMSKTKCAKHFTKVDKDKLKKKIDRFLDKEKLSYSGVLDTIKYIDMLKGKSKTEYKYKLITFILHISVKQRIPQKIVNEIVKIL
tara:strand:- start:944 stop:1327 length:384 start_codon:yes stop_codon:yes gene_type:complete